jgi:acetoin utilization deacetylase AcuC-like enzyme
MLAHEVPPGHPEHRGRLQAVLDALDDEAFASLIRVQATPIELDAIERVHTRRHIDRVLAARPPHEGMMVPLDPDTMISKGSVHAARMAAGACVQAVDLVLAGDVERAFCAVRPPGHHAEPDRAMGFCLFNSIAIAAYHARAVHGLRRVAIIDFDVHHGNGSQKLAEADADLFYGSIHQERLYPHTGFAYETGPAQNVCNAPVPAGTEGALWRRTFAEHVLAPLAQWQPEMLLISAGFDGHKDDPLAGLRLVEADYVWVSRELCALADAQCAGRVVSALEGGYDLDATARSASAHVRVLLGD